MHTLENRKDDTVEFKLMGIDHLYVDESHKFKNLTFNTRHDRVAGLGNPEGSGRALNMLFAIRTIQQRTGRDLGATFLSGTTISNSLTELYLLFKYLRPQEMERQNLKTFDAWAAVFAKKSIDYEFSVTNEIVQKERFRYFIKVPELAALFRDHRLPYRRRYRHRPPGEKRDTAQHTAHTRSDGIYRPSCAICQDRRRGTAVPGQAYGKGR